ncbi:MAG: hypothetical protein PVJ92_02780 [Candidatus Dependentiae bacterium]
MWFLITYAGGSTRLRRLFVGILIGSSLIALGALLLTWSWHRRRCHPLATHIIHTQQLLVGSTSPAPQPFSCTGSLADIAAQVRAMPGGVARATLRAESGQYVLRGKGGSEIKHCLPHKRCLPELVSGSSAT